MKLKQLITGGALAATVLTLGSAQAEERNPYEGIVFCKATVLRANPDAPSAISVTLPFTTTGSDGRQYTHWNLGKVAAGGVADSWHSDKGPGRFVAHNNGVVGAYIYLTSAPLHAEYWGDWYMHGDYGLQAGDSVCGDEIREGIERVFGECEGFDMWPCTSVELWRRDEMSYCLAFTRDIQAKIPTWHILNRCLYFDSEYDSSIGEDRWSYAWREEENQCRCIGAYMGYLDSGEHMPFDVKFWAPHFWNMYESERPVYFTFRVEAASFPLWEHDLEVQ